MYRTYLGMRQNSPCLYYCRLNWIIDVEWWAGSANCEGCGTLCDADVLVRPSIRSSARSR